MQTISQALDEVKNNHFSIDFVTHDKTRGKGGKIKSFPEVMILNRENIDTHQLEISKPDPDPEQTDGVEAPKKRSNFIRIVILVGGQPDSSPPINVFIPLITRINDQKLTI